jgi:lipopolysaccharide transport system permease protein
MSSFICDVKTSLKWWRFWSRYALQDVKNRYTRSFVGPFWVTISMGVVVVAIGPLYGSIFGSSSTSYYLYLATGLVYWAFISQTVSESCDLFLANGVFIKQTDIPLMVYVLRLLTRNVILFFHNLVIPVLIAPFVIGIDGNIVYLLLWVLLTVLVLFPAVLIASIICTRFRDMTPIIQNIMQLFMFLTPIFWVLGDNRRQSLYVNYNPFYYLVDGFRFCFGNPGSALHVTVILLLATLLFPLAVYLYKNYSHRVVYWI